MVVISFSSTFQNQSRAIQNSINALADLPVNGCVTLGPAMQDQQFTTPPNVKLLHAVKHSLLFPHADLVITHGGHGTIIRALSNGVPILCLPMGRDQNDNGAKVELKGCGLKLSPKASPGKIRTATQQILNDPRYANNAGKMQQLILSKAETVDAIQEIEKLVSRSPARVSA
ncbi:MAG: hypothetical protein KDC24_12770 [Saprospiraceae bacterium]|nr:hypothetical protein [Saprospiraceae bacterium]